MGPSGVCVCQRESGAGSRVKGGADPGGARGSQLQSGRRGGFVVSDGGTGFSRDVRHDKDEADRRAERIRGDRAALLSTHTALYPAFCLILPISCCVNLFHLLFTMLRVSLMCQSLSTFTSRHSLRSSLLVGERLFFKDLFK